MVLVSRTANSFSLPKGARFDVLSGGLWLPRNTDRNRNSSGPVDS